MATALALNTRSLTAWEEATTPEAARFGAVKKWAEDFLKAHGVEAASATKSIEMLEKNGVLVSVHQIYSACGPKHDPFADWDPKPPIAVRRPLDALGLQAEREMMFLLADGYDVLVRECTREKHAKAVTDEYGLLPPACVARTRKP